MPNRKGYDRMIELSTSVTNALRDLEAGKLSNEELERCTEEARTLYERLVVLRHKMREAAVAPAAEPPPAVIEVSGPAPMRLDTRPPEVPIRQTSLIDAIAETEAVPGEVLGTDKPVVPTGPKEVTQVPKPAPTPAPAPVQKKTENTSVADRMEHAPVADLHKAIALSQKFWFVAELFRGQREIYEKTIDAINGLTTYDDAKALIDRDVLAQLQKPPGDDVLTTFMELVQRRFR